MDPMESQTGALILRDDARLQVRFSPQAIALKTAALEKSALVGKVTNAAEQEAAVAAQRALHEIINLAKKAKTFAKAPVLEFGTRIESALKDFLKELLEESARTSALVGDFQQLEQQRARAAEQARNAQLSELEREKSAKLAQAKSHEEVDAIQEHFNRLAEATPVHQPVRAEGQRVSADWEIIVTDIHTLYRFHANCVELKPRISEIKNLLKMGVTVNGITAKPIVKATVVTGGKAPEINV